MSPSLPSPRKFPIVRRLAGLSLSVAVVVAGVTFATHSSFAGTLQAAAPLAAATPTTPPASYPNPGAVTGDVGVHDPTIVVRPGGGYLIAHTGNNIALKTSADRTAFRNAGTWNADGTPNLGTPVRLGTTLTAPSGE